MANAEDRDLEDILVEKDAPKRVEAKENIITRKAKLTSRTIASLKEKIKEKRLDRAYAKYNKKYQKMKKAAIEAADARQAKVEGADITESELAVDYSIVASYDRKLARMGARLLKQDIKAVAASTDVSDKLVVGKRIKVPRFLLTKMRGLVASVEKIKTKKERKKVAKELKKETKEFIRTSLDGALFKEDGTLQEKIDTDVIKNLSLKGGKNDTERRLDTLKGFISLDGKSSLFGNNDKEKELEKETKTNTDLPPIEPSATVEKEEPKINVDDLLKGFEKKPVVEEETQLNKEANEEKEKSKIQETVPTNNTVLSQKQEIDEILTHADLINKLRTTLRKTTDPEVKAALEKELTVAKENFNKLIKVDNKEVNKQGERLLEPITVEPKSETKDLIKPSTENENKKNGSMENVEVKKPESIRVSQVSTPSALRVTLQDIKKLEERNKTAQLQIAQLKREKEELESQKEILKEYIAKASMTRDAEVQARNMAESNEALKGEVEELTSQASVIQSDLGRSK